MALPKSESILADQPATADEAELIARYVKPHPHRGDARRHGSRSLAIAW